MSQTDPLELPPLDDFDQYRDRQDRDEPWRPPGGKVPKAYWLLVGVLEQTLGQSFHRGSRPAVRDVLARLDHDGRVELLNAVSWAIEHEVFDDVAAVIAGACLDEYRANELFEDPWSVVYPGCEEQSSTVAAREEALYEAEKDPEGQGWVRELVAGVASEAQPPPSTANSAPHLQAPPDSGSAEDADWEQARARLLAGGDACE